ncbi:MAG: response regulator transcription factor [Pseudomonadota bacterium]
MKILIADDHELVRDTLCAFLEREGGFEIRTVDSYQAARETIEAAGPFDLVLLDWSMPGMEGFGSVEMARALNDGKPVAIMSGTADRSVAQEALDRGAAGFLPKSMAARSLVNAVRFMGLGEQYAPLDFMTAAEPETPRNPLADQLSSRESEVLDGICRGLSNKEIARELSLQEVTVKLHVKTLCRKLDARNRTQAAMIAKESGLV